MMFRSRKQLLLAKTFISPLRGRLRLVLHSFPAAAMCALLWPSSVIAQSRTLTACTPGPLGLCTELQLTATGTTLKIAIRNLGITSEPMVPSAFYNLVLGTGRNVAPSPVTTLVAPVARRGATISDATPWEVFDTGDALFLSALSGRGVGSCAVGADVGGFGQATRTCGSGQFTTFSFLATNMFDPDAFTLLNLEAVALDNTLRGFSCGAPEAACEITADTRRVGVVPEPASVVLLATGLICCGVGYTQRRRA